MKMEHLIVATQGGIVRLIAAKVGDTLYKDDPIVFIEPVETAGELEVAGEDVDLDAIRPDLAEMIARQGFTLDENRPMRLPGVEKPISAPHAKILQHWSIKTA